jgi:hypothetical protein
MAMSGGPTHPFAALRGSRRRTRRAVRDRCREAGWPRRWWPCSDDACTWTTVRTVNEFDSKNHWLIDRGNGQPSVNVVILSFVHPLKLLNQTTDAGTLNGVPRGMTTDIVNYFTSRNLRVMVSIGGITYTDAWNQALAQSATLVGQRAAALATQLGVGVEIDYEENTKPNLTGLRHSSTRIGTSTPTTRSTSTASRCTALPSGRLRRPSSRGRCSSPRVRACEPSAPTTTHR